MNYKKIIRSQHLRLKILSLLSPLPDKLMLNIQYYLKLSKKINWNNPTRFTEWIQWYKINYRNTLMFKCVDKYLVRDYVEKKGLGHILNSLIGVYDKAEDINFKTLPEKFVIKTTDGSGANNVIICRNKRDLNVEKTREKLNSWFNLKNINAGREWAYTGIPKSQIIIEKLLENPQSIHNDVEDYKIFCFGGKPSIISYDSDRFQGHKRNFFDTEWNRINVDSDCQQKECDIIKPKNFDTMLQIAKNYHQIFLS